MQKLFIFSTLLLTLAACKKQKKPQESIPPKGQSVSLTVKNPDSYCEKSFYCSYSTLVTDAAKRTMLYKRKAFIATCEAAMAQMDSKITTLYNKCVAKKCGEELRTCLLTIGGKHLILPAPKSSPQKNVASIKGPKNTNDATTRGMQTAPSGDGTPLPKNKPAAAPPVPSMIAKPMQMHR